MKSLMRSMACALLALCIQTSIIASCQASLTKASCSCDCPKDGGNDCCVKGQQAGPLIATAKEVSNLLLITDPTATANAPVLVSEQALTRWLPVLSHPPPVPNSLSPPLV
ncbi:MAG: hypothetical protein AABZ44_03240 [Elusimicrobiota bacterium]